MLATGGFLACAALLMLSTVASAVRSDPPPRWITYGWVGEVVALAIVCALALGLTALGAGAITTSRTGPDYLDLGLLAGVVLVAGAVRRWSKARARPAPLEADAGLRVVVSGARDGSGGGRAVPAGPAPASASQPPPQRAA